jgi:hypothetical protein
VSSRNRSASTLGPAASGRRRVAALARLTRSAVDGDEAGVAVGEVEVPRAVDRGPGLRAAGILEVVVADQADVRDRQGLDELEVLPVAVGAPRPGEVAEIGEEDGCGLQLGGLAQELGEDRVGGRVRPRAAVAGHHERERVVDLRGADALGHAEVAIQRSAPA